MKLLELNLKRLLQAELLQLIKRLEEDAISMGMDLTKDALMNKLYQILLERTNPYAEGLRQIKKHQETQRIAQLDEARDKALRSLRRVISASQYSPIAEEQMAYHKLNLLLKEFNGIERLNYEQETALLDTLLKRLAQEEYQRTIGLLGIERYISHLIEVQKAFNGVFALRSSDLGLKEVYDMVQLRQGAQIAYMDLCHYVLLLAKTFPDVYTAYLHWINNSRSYYADIIAHRKGLKKASSSESF